MIDIIEKVISRIGVEDFVDHDEDGDVFAFICGGTECMLEAVDRGVVFTIDNQSIMSDDFDELMQFFEECLDINGSVIDELAAELRLKFGR